MPYITHQTPSSYRDRHSDWYYGLFRDVCHQVGLIGEYLFWLNQDQQCRFVDSICPDWFPFNYVQDFFISIFKAHYNANYVYVYDEWALQACKCFERIEGKFTETINTLTSQANALVNDAKAKLQSQINELNNLTTQFKAQLSDLTSAKNKLLADVKDLDARIRKLESAWLLPIKIPSIGA